MRAGALVVGVIGMAILATVAVGGSATGACPEPSPSPTQTSAVIGVEIPGATAAPTPSPSASCVPTETGGSGSGGTGTGGAATGGGTGTGRGSSSALAELPVGPPGAPVVPASPTENADALQLDPETVVAGGMLQAKGSGYAAGEQVQVVLYSTPVIIASFAADAGGTVFAMFRVPVDTRPGTHTVEATGWTSEHVANARFVVITGAADDAGGPPIAWWLIGILAALLIAVIAAAIHFWGPLTRLPGMPAATRVPS